VGRTACTEPQCLYKGALYLRVEVFLYSPYGPYGLYRASVPVQGRPLPFFYSACAANVGRKLAMFMLNYHIYLYLYLYLYSSHSNRLPATCSTVYCISIFIFYLRLLCFLTFDIKILCLKALPFLSRTELPSRSSRLMNIFVHEA
jgi:hypothetical protein